MAKFKKNTSRRYEIVQFFKRVFTKKNIIIRVGVRLTLRQNDMDLSL